MFRRIDRITGSYADLVSGTEGGEEEESSPTEMSSGSGYLSSIKDFFWSPAKESNAEVERT